MKRLLIYIPFLLAFLLTACQGVFEDGSSSECTLRLKVSRSVEQNAEEGQFPMNAPVRTAALSDWCTRIQCAVFHGDTKVKILNQEQSDADFGTLSLSLTPGTYRIVILAHNGLGNATISLPEKITFKDNKCTDTFIYYTTLDLTESTTMDAVLHRAVGAFRLIITDSIPSQVARMRFYYTGGSSTLDATTGYGCVNSKQTEYREVESGEGAFTIYTFPHEETDFLNINVQALDANDQLIHEKNYENYIVQPNWITQHKDAFFSTNDNAQSLKLSLYDDGQWSGIFEQ